MVRFIGSQRKKPFFPLGALLAVIRMIIVDLENIMENWEKQLSCAEECSRCSQSLDTKDRRILSVIDHQPICADCKKEEEKRPDYENASRQMMAECLEQTSKPYGDPASYCFHHFCPFKCD